MPDSLDQSGLSRRTVLRASGLIALTGGGVTVLAACAADADTAQQPAASAAASSTTPSPSAPSAPSASSATPEASTSSKPTSKPRPKKKAPRGPSVTTADVPVGGGVILKNAGFVVTQPTKGTYRAFTKICTHMGCKVASIKNENIHCDCHGSEFSIKDGSVTHPPASKPLKEFETTVFGRRVYVTK
jgi:Rieske Fe-S protein